MLISGMALHVRRKACALVAATLLSWWPTASVNAADASPVGSVIPEVTVGKATYRNAKIRSVSARTVMIEHNGALTSLRLRDLPPELQAQLGYRPELEAEAEQAIAAGKAKTARERIQAREQLATRLEKAHQAKFEQILQNFGQSPEIQEKIDLRPALQRYDLAVKSQGRRPSCSVFAVVSALEFQRAELIGHAEKLSEEYLVWATRKTITRTVDNTPEVAAEDTGDSEKEGSTPKDEGFSIGEVVTALRGYGIPLQSAMPNSFGIKMSEITDPAPEVIAEAREHCRVFIHRLPGRDNATVIANFVQALNAGVPVVIGLRWPHYRTVRAGYLNEQKPILDYAHAVTLVGYKSPRGQLSGTTFSFKNSYGIDWGMGGYGEVTFSYLEKYLLDAVMLEVDAGPVTASR